MAAPLRARLQSAIADASDDVRSFLEGPRGRRWALRSGRGRLGGLALAVLALVVYLPGALSMPPVDRDESRFAQASRQMFESVALPEDQRDEKRHSGGVVVPRVQDRDRLNKPPLIYWVQAMSAAVLTGGEPLDDAIWMYRVPSVLCAVLAVLFTWRLGLVLFDPRAAWLGAALLAVCPIMVWEAGQARADSLLLACTTGALWAMARVLTSKQGGALAALLFWVALALASLAKFPVPLMVAGLALIAWIIATREVGSLARLRPVTGLIVFAAMTLPWVFAVGDRIGWDVMLESLSNETL
ncbi:MAG: glycosyltransferase family 39 protein, partial [Planctomycetota bacterium]